MNFTESTIMDSEMIISLIVFSRIVISDTNNRLPNGTNRLSVQNTNILKKRTV